jgi:hypothetical protein
VRLVFSGVIQPRFIPYKAFIKDNKEIY